MKKILLSLSALVILALPKASAQIINPGFETWSVDAIASSTNDPNSGIGNSGWWDFNFTNYVLFGSSPATVFKGTGNPPPENGSAYAEIVSNVMSSTTYGDLHPYGFNYPDTNGLLFTAYINVVGTNLTYKRGEPFSGGRLNKYSFYYRYIPVGGSGGDTATCGVVMYKAGAVIGAGLWECYTTTTAWTPATVTITYTGLGNPDTILIQYNACSNYHNHGHTGNGPKPGDTLDIDNATITGIDNVSEQLDKVNLYPNPANTQINLAVTGQFNATRVEIYDMTGRQMGTYSMNNNFLTINTQSYKSGMYFYKLLDNTGAQLNVGKFSIVK